MTAPFVDYNQILDDVKSLMETQITGASKPFKLIGTNLMTRDFVLQHMPLADIRLAAADPEARVGQNYYTGVNVEIEIAAFDLSSRDDAIRIANELLALTQKAITENGHFGAVWESVLLGHVDFLSAEVKAEGFAASVVMQVTINVFSDT